MISHRYQQYHRYIGTISDADYVNKKFEVKFVKVNNYGSTEVSRQESFHWFEMKHLRSFMSPRTSKQITELDDMTKALYAGTLISIRKEIKKTPDKKLLLFSAGLCNYIEMYEPGFLRVRNIEIVQDNTYKELDYEIEQISR